MTEEIKHRVFISIGSNIGEKKTNCKRALLAISDKGIARVIKVSGFYMTEPVNYKDQSWFVNAAAIIETGLGPEELLYELKKTEQEFGTYKKSVRFGPRLIDIDILLYDDLVLRTENLCIPHERMHERVFVLKPLCDINGGILHPVLKQTVRQLLDEVDGSGQEIMLMEEEQGLKRRIAQ